MHVAAGADTLHDLLAEIAAFVEVKCASLSCLLGQISIADVGSVARSSFENSQSFESLGPTERCARPSECIDEFVRVL